MITFPLQNLLAQFIILVAGLVAVDVNQSPLAVRDEIMVLVQSVAQLPQDQLEGLRLEIRRTNCRATGAACPDNLLTLLISVLLRFNSLAGQEIFLTART